MKKVLSVLLMVCLLCAGGLVIAYAQEDITEAFTDELFRAAVYERIGKTEPDEPILDTDVSGIASLDVSNLGIQSLDGLEYFTGLVTLNCQGNALEELPTLPVGLQYLYCQGNELTALPALPAGLFFLNCGENLLTALPALPAALEYLHCQGNALETLPTLSAKLWTLDCGGNALTSLPALPKSLRYLYCKENLLAGLDVTGLTLFKLDCSHNRMTTTHSVRGFAGAWDAVNFIYSPQDAEQAEFIPVTGIAGLPTAATVGTPLALAGEVTPANATNQTIAWSVANTGATGAVITGGVLHTTAAGTVTLMAAVADGTAPGVPYQRTFSVAVSAGGSDSPNTIFNTGYEATLINWLLFIFLFGWIWMWF
ncbi:MAG: hypothetical protein FWE98_08650 [Oscillospiraceae bacterium]|nr:hypothetical protein [Oscillospiraceae bacterium]